MKYSDVKLTPLCIAGNKTVSHFQT